MLQLAAVLLLRVVLFALHIFIFSLFPVQKVSGVDQRCAAAAVLQTVDDGSHPVTCWILWKDIPLHFEELILFTFINFFFPINLTNIFSFLFSLYPIFICFSIHVHLFMYCLIIIFLMNWLVKAEKFE